MTKERRDQEIRGALAAIMVSASIFEYQGQWLSEEEREFNRGVMCSNLTELDKMHVPFCVQNSALHLGYTHDLREYYVSDLLKEIKL